MIQLKINTLILLRECLRDLKQIKTKHIRYFLSLVLLASAGIETGRFEKGYFGLWKLEPVINESLINEHIHAAQAR